MRKKVITKEQILQITGELVKEKGIKACSMRAIAEEANIAVGTLYNYFSSNQSLLEAFFEDSWNRTIKRLEGISNEITSEEQLKLCYNYIKEDIQDRKGLGRELFGINAFVGDLGDVNKKIHESLSEVVFRIVRKSPRNDKFSDIQVKLISRWVFFSIIDNVVLGTENEEEVIQMLVKCYL